MPLLKEIRGSTGLSLKDQPFSATSSHVSSVGTQLARLPARPRNAACGAAGVQMNLFSRLFRVARSYANALGECQFCCCLVTCQVYFATLIKQSFSRCQCNSSDALRLQ